MKRKNRRQENDKNIKTFKLKTYKHKQGQTVHRSKVIDK